MEVASEQAHAGHAPHQGCHTVDVFVDNKRLVLHPGHYDVPTFKKVSGVPLADDLDQLVECKLVHVPDNASVHIRGCEIFISHIKDGGSS